MVLAQVFSANGPSPADQALMDWIQKLEEGRRANYEMFTDYYRGIHPTQLTDRLHKFLNIKSDFRFADNFCVPVIDALVERLSVSGMAAESEEYAAWGWQTWQANRSDALQVLVHTEAILKGDAYVMAAWDAERAMVRWHHQDPALIIPHYDGETGKLLWLSKKWLADQGIGQIPLTRLNLYYPERIEKYVAQGRVWQRHTEQDDRGRVEPWPLPWVDARGQPLGIPVVHFRNRPLGEDFGVSELVSVIPLQDLLNKTMIDLVQIMDTMAWRQRWTLNTEPVGTSYTYVPGAVWEMTAEDAVNARIGEFEAADPQGILRAVETIVQHVAAVSRTPQHLFNLGGDWPSGEALKTAEAGLVAKAKLRQIEFGNSWEDLVYLSRRIQDEFGSPVVAPLDAQVETLWEDPESRNEREHLEALGIKAGQLGIPKRQLWRELGYTPDEIAQMEQDITDQRVTDSNIGAEILKQFEQGG